MTPIQPCGPKAHSDIDLRLAAEHLNKIDDDYLTGLHTAIEDIDKAASHSDITVDEHEMITAVSALAHALMVLGPPASVTKTVRNSLAIVCTNLAKGINERESDYGYGLVRR